MGPEGLLKIETLFKRLNVDVLITPEPRRKGVRWLAVYTTRRRANVIMEPLIEAGLAFNSQGSDGAAIPPPETDLRDPLFVCRSISGLTGGVKVVLEDLHADTST